MSVGALIQRDAIQRASIVDAELGWEIGTTLGKMAMLWQETQEGGVSVARKRNILEWARVPAFLADRFLAACCQESEDAGDHVHFLEPRGDDRYLIVGNPEEIAKLEKIRADKSFAGKQSGKKRKAEAEKRKAEIALKEASDQQLMNSCSNTCSTTVATETQQNANPLPSPPPAKTTHFPEGGTDAHIKAAHARVDPPNATHPPKGRVFTLAELGDLWEQATGSPPIGDDRAALRAFCANDFLAGRKPGERDGTYFQCADPIAWVIKRRDELVAGKYPNFGSGKTRARNRMMDVPDDPTGAACEHCAGFGCPSCEPPDPGDGELPPAESLDPQPEGEFS